MSNVEHFLGHAWDVKAEKCVFTKDKEGKRADVRFRKRERRI